MPPGKFGMAISSDISQNSESEITKLKRVLDRQIGIDALTTLINAIGDQTDEVGFSETAVGIDTNILLKLSSSTMAEDVFDYLGSEHAPPLILPGQAIQEFWNNQLNAVQTRADKLAKSFQKFSEELDKFGTDFGDFASSIRVILDQFSSEYGHVYDEATVRKTLKLLAVLKEKSSVPFVPRSDFKAIADMRSSTKTPPGFRDDGDGDFFIWADFLYGLKLQQISGATFDRAVLVTEDKKPDWSRKGLAHPILVSEAQAYLGVPFELWSQERLIREVTAQIQNPVKISV
jgi:hypothetical protein